MDTGRGLRPRAYGPSRNDDLAIGTTAIFAAVFMGVRTAGAGRICSFDSSVSLLATIAVFYVALLACYLITCVVVTRLNRHAVKIQSSRQTPISHIKRDFRQSAVSLAVIAVMLGAGDWSYSTLGWGLRALSGIGARTAPAPYYVLIRKAA